MLPPMASSNPFLDGVLKVLREVATRALKRAARPQRTTRKTRTTSSTRKTRTTSSARNPRGSGQSKSQATDGYPGDYRGRPTIAYDPHPDGLPDPGEIVWTWVPYEEDHSRGKDRPVLLIGRDRNWLLGLQITSQDHDRDAAQEARAGRYWVDIGTGDWDAQRRPSEVRVNRIVRIDPGEVRRIGAVLPQDRFDAVARELARHY